MKFRVGDRVRIEGVVERAEKGGLQLYIKTNDTDGSFSAYASRCQLIDSPLRPGDRVETIDPTHRQYTVRSEVINGYVFVEPFNNLECPNPFTSSARNFQRISDASQNR